MLDIGCGTGELLSRLEGQFQKRVGLESSTEAIAQGRRKYPGIEFVPGEASCLETSLEGDRLFDAILFCDVIHDLDEKGQRAAFHWIQRHLSEGGFALIAAWCPGGDHPSPSELERLMQREFVIESKLTLDTLHVLWRVTPKRHLVAMTVDCETWHPVYQVTNIDWKKDLMEPTRRLMDLFSLESIPLTLMAEMGGYFWLQEHQPKVAEQLAEVWRDAVRGGHDVQLCLHPNWLPELGAVNRSGTWDWSQNKVADYPGDLSGLIRRCKTTLESLLVPIRPDYRVTCFRAGAYQAQPFQRLYDALTENGIPCDSSVYAGGASTERDYDFSFAYSDHQPYHANRFDPQLKAPPAETGVVELPVFTSAPNPSWFRGATPGDRWGERLLTYLRGRDAAWSSPAPYRFKKQLREYMTSAYSHVKPIHGGLQTFLPRRWLHSLAEYGPEPGPGNEYFVLIGHPKADLLYEGIAENLEAMQQDDRFEFVTLSRMTKLAQMDLQRIPRPAPAAVSGHQVHHEAPAIMEEERQAAQARYVEDWVPWDRNRLLDLGCGTGHRSAELAGKRPWLTIVGVDNNSNLISQAREIYGSDRASFQVEDFQNLSFPAASFDAVYAGGVLEKAFDVTGVLHEILRVLKPGGVLTAAIPSDGRNPAKSCLRHTWKTFPGEVHVRLSHAGFADVEIKEIDTLNKLGQTPYPPSMDHMMFIRAWKRQQVVSRLERAIELMAWVHRNLETIDPAAEAAAAAGHDAREILAVKNALPKDFAALLGALLQREDFEVGYLTMVAADHPLGQGPAGEKIHEAVQIILEDGQPVVLDPFFNVCFPHAIQELVSLPKRANVLREKDVRYR
ncbi:MAG: methyltransferase domain-containing protein, partial [Nitrospinaceae bacterium]